MRSTSPTPIALFVYARPEHTLRTLQALSANHMADQTLLYVFADGPPDDASPETLNRINEVREIVSRHKWCGEVRIMEAESNKGLADSIINGVSLVCQEHGSAIVLEDDLETSPAFLKYMNDALKLYHDDQRVMQISGFNVQNRLWAAETGFLRVSTSWGWATWDRAWQRYSNDAAELLKAVNERGSSQFDLDGHSFHYEELEKNVRGDLKTWAVRWYASVFLNDGLCLYPRQTLVRNHGFDGTGVNCHDDKTDYHRRLKLKKNVELAKLPLVEDPQYLSSMQRHYIGLKQLWSGTRFRDRLMRKLRRVFTG